MNVMSDHTVHSSAGRRIGGLLLAFSSIVAFAAQAFSVLQWQGLYSLSDNLISDLGATRCDVVADGFVNRFVCSPGHGIFNAGMIFSGVLLALGALAVAVMARRAPRAIPVGALLLLSGVAIIVIGAVPFDVNSGVHDVAALAATILTLLAMVLFALPVRAAAEQPLGFGPFVPATWVMLAASAVGLVLLLVGWDRPGLWERLAMDVQTLWVLLVGISLVRVSPSERALARQRSAQDAAAEKDAAVLSAVRKETR